MLILLVAFLGYSFYKNSKNGQKEQDVNQPTATVKIHKEAKDSEPMTKKEVKGIIEEELNENPDIIINA